MVLSNIPKFIIKQTQEVKQAKQKTMKFYIYNNTLKAYYSGVFAGMPSWTPTVTKAESFDCPIEAGDFAWKWKTCGDLVVID